MHKICTMDNHSQVSSKFVILFFFQLFMECKHSLLNPVYNYKRHEMKMLSQIFIKCKMIDKLRVF